MMVQMSIDAATLADAARMLRELLAAAPPTTPRERRLASRLQGAMVALDALAADPMKTANMVDHQ